MTKHALVRRNSRRGRLPMIFQSETTECALACLAMISNYYGRQMTIGELRDLYPVSLRGLTLRNIISVAARICLGLRPVRCEIDDLSKVQCPAMLHWDLEHFVVLRRIRGKRFEVFDPARGILSLTEKEFSNHFTGIAVEASPTQEFTEGTGKPSLTFGKIFRQTNGLARPLIYIGILSLFFELLSLASPAFTKVIIDTGVASGDRTFLATALAAFVVLVASQSGVSYIRDHTVMFVGASYNYQLVRGVVTHLLKLPLEFFEKRQIGDLVDRYHATNYIRSMFVGSLPVAVLDGLFALISLILVMVLAPVLALISLGALLSYLAVKSSLFRSVQSQTEKVIHAKALEQGFIIESLRCIVPIKVAARENERKGVWYQRYADYLNAEAGMARLFALQQSARLAIVGLDVGVSLVIGASAVISMDMSLGTFFGVLMYKSLFTLKSGNLVDRAFEFKMHDIHLSRLGDILLAKPERGADQFNAAQSSSEKGAVDIRLQNVSFRYSDNEPWIMEDVCLNVPSGQFVAITGRSGAGKTTFVKILLGLYKPTRGQVFIGDESISKIDIYNHRSRFGVVMQDDELLTGTITENISFFDPTPDVKRVRRCAKLACIHDEICDMPMRYNSRLGEMGAALSGGQIQRLLLARSLYRRPAALIMDEGTANLDPEVEAKILDNLKELSITRLFVTHSPSAIAMAHRVLRFDDGQIK